MTRDELIKRLSLLPSDVDVEFQLGGWSFEIVDVRHDESSDKGAVIVFQVGEDPATAHDARWKAIPQLWRPNPSNCPHP